MEPGLEALGIAQGPQLTPRHDERSLDRILGEVGVAQDPNRDRHASVADRASQGVEGLRRRPASHAPRVTDPSRSFPPWLQAPCLHGR